MILPIIIVATREALRAIPVAIREAAYALGATRWQVVSDHLIPYASGGIYTGEDICRFLEMGAAGVQMGTRFVATVECDADEAFKQAYVRAKKEDIVIIQSPVGMPGRAVKGPFLDDVAQGNRKPRACAYKCIVTCDHTKSPYCIAQALVNAMKGKLKHGFAFAGANAWRVDSIVTVRELVNQLRDDFMRFCGKKD
jgi:nitronate monooxygenase